MNRLKRRKAYYIVSEISVCLTEKRLYNGKGIVEFDFEGSSKPPKYRQRMNERDTLKSIRAKMVSLSSFPS